MMQRLNLCTLDVASLVEDEAWWKIYDASFPDAERESRDVLTSAVSIGRGIAVAARQADTTVGIASATLLFDRPAVFLSYIASAHNVRGMGIGRTLFEYAWTEGARALELSGLSDGCMICEVEKPSCATTPAEVATRERRIRFFVGLGGVLLSRPYLQPPLFGRAPVPLVLVYFDRRHEGEPNANRQDQLVRAIYRERYEEINKVDHDVLAELFLRTS